MSTLIGLLTLVVLVLAALALLPHAMRGASVAWPLARRLLGLASWALAVGVVVLLSYLIPGPQTVWAWLSSHDDERALIVSVLVAFVIWRLLEWWLARAGRHGTRR